MIEKRETGGAWIVCENPPGSVLIITQSKETGDRELRRAKKTNVGPD
jgi:hypothetical protein